MDNLSHSLSGALAGKFLDPAVSGDGAERRRMERTLFWLIVLCANLPDADVVVGLFTDPLTSYHAHRGITHSILFAPVLAVFPAGLFARFSRVKNFALLWGVALGGLLLHIFFDLITSYGTQIFAPLSDHRYALNWMFIIDPVFTGVLGLALFLARKIVRRRRVITIGAAVFVAAYLGVEMLNQSLAQSAMEEYIRRRGIVAQTVTAMPQPLSIFRWKALAQTDEGVLQAFFSVPDAGEGELEVASFPHAHDAFTEKALGTPEARWYMSFALHPHISSVEERGLRHVEIRDMQFTIDPRLLAAVGFGERNIPFILRFTYTPDGELQGITFNDKPVGR